MNPFYLRNFLKLSDFNSENILFLLNFSEKIKFKKIIQKEKKFLKNKNLALIFEKKSTRTRCSFEIAAFDQGAKTTYLGPKDTHLGYKESIEDTAETLGKMYDGILYRGYKQKIIKKLAKYSKIPIWNGLTNEHHPTQILSDLLTIKEIFPQKNINQIKITYIGDSTNNISNSLLEASNLLNFKLSLISPKKYFPKKKFFNKYSNIKKNIKLTEDIEIGIKNADIVYTDVWISMGEKIENQEEKIISLKKYQVNKKILKLSKNPFVKVFHCLPALHNKKTIFGKEIIKKFNLKNGVEITDDIFNLNKKIIFQQSSNRVHIMKSLIINCLIKNNNL
ncbi:MAG: ornithine carbamoyltransferase [Buchnera aphidicola (Periphyllus acericola)]|uniref:ornithine carbamoyltransferase n=1 Tax=Buchnera aphidicola TaxID=9 RepID=UPI0030CFE2F3|nr:ornithine carbamoyltransferase [Buchnera aphidicola (Periphyllus acericola)]